MTSSIDSQQFESYVPVYDVVPEKWDDARPFIVEQLKKVSNAINIREIGWFLDEELLSGKAFIPGLNNIMDGGSSQVFRQIFRKVVDCGALTSGVKNVPHGITFDNNFTLIQLWVSATNSTTFQAITMSDPQNVDMDATNININSPAVYDRSFAVIEYLLEV
jgi:hypothetical protein